MLSKKNNFLSLLISSMFVLFLFPTNIKPYIIFLFGCTVIYKSICAKAKFDWNFFLNYSLIYLIICITIFYSTNLSQGLLLLQTTSSLIVFPIIFSFISKDDYFSILKKNNLFYWCFIITIIVFHILIFSWFYIYEFSFFDTLKHFQAIITDNLGRLSIHPIYMSILCILGIFFSYTLFKKEKNRRIKVIIVFLQMALFFLLILHSKKGPIISFFITIIIYFFINKKRVLKPLLLLSCLIILFFSIPKIQNRFSEILKIETLNSENVNSTNIRFAVYNNSLELIKEKPFFGYGIGDYNDKLKENYKKNNQDVLLLKEYNAHNQYLSFTLIGGLLLLFVYFYFFIKNIRISYLNNNFMFVLILLFFSITMFTESILERESGVVFFSFFLCFFGCKNRFKN